MEIGDKLYRYHNEQSFNGENLFFLSRVKIVLEEFVVIDTTNFGAWYILDSIYQIHKNYDNGLEYMKKNWAKWTKLNAKRPYVHPTKEQALKSFKIRKQRQISHCERQLHNAKESLKLIEEMNET